MGKKKMMVKCLFIYALPIMLLFSVNTYAQGLNNLKFSFQKKSQIIEWGEKEFGFNAYSDSISFNVEGIDFFFFFGEYGSGVQKKIIFVFSRRNIGKKADWILFCMRDTNTSKVSVELDQKSREIVFKAKSGKTLMILPFETLKMNYDPSEH